MACEVCHKIYTPDENQTDTDVKPHLCVTCGHSFSLKIQLKRHLMLHADNVSYTCITCAKSVDGKGKTYNLRLGNKNEYTCDVCEKSFSNKRMLLRHSIQHTLDKLSDTEETEYDNKIPKRSIANSKRRYYRKKSEKKELLSCNVCDRKFSTWLALERHSLTHRVPKSFRTLNCKFCNKEFIYQASLEKHVLKNKCNKSSEAISESVINKCVDQEDKKHMCTICGKTFARKSSLDGHEISHIIDKNTTDEEKEFSDVQEKLSDSKEKVVLKNDKEKKLIFKRKKKIKSEEPKFTFNFEKSYMCDKCNFVCFSKLTLEKHYLNHGQKNVTLSEIPKQSEDNCTEVPPIKLKWRKQRGQRCKNYVCDTCGRRFAGEICFKKHILKHENEKKEAILTSSNQLEKKKEKTENIKILADQLEKITEKEGKATTTLDNQSEKKIEEAETTTIPVNRSEKKNKKIKPVKELICVYCEEVFTGRKSAYVKHMHAHTPEVCGICDERFVDRQSLREHCKIHVGTEEGRMFMQCSQKALDAKIVSPQPEPKVEYIYLVLR